MNNRQIVTNSWSTQIDKLMVWRSSWTKYEHKISNNCVLRVIYDQILILSDTKVLESFNMNQKMKGVYKNNTMILIVKSNNNEIRRIKFQIKSNTAQCLEALAKHFPVICHNGLPCDKSLDSKFRSIEEVMKQALACKDQNIPTNLPTDFENFIKLCLLDPSFPQMVVETERILNKINIKK